jgi:hypothetical protein
MPGAGRGGLRDLRLRRNDFGGRRWLRNLLDLFDSMNILVWNFPAEVTPLAALLHVLLEEDRATGIRRECAGSGQKNIAHSILHGDFAAQKLSVRRHSSESARAVASGSIVLMDCYFAGCGKLAAAGFGRTTRSPAISTNSAEKNPYPRIAATTGVAQKQPWKTP